MHDTWPGLAHACMAVSFACPQGNLDRFKGLADSDDDDLAPKVETIQ